MLITARKSSEMASLWLYKLTLKLRRKRPLKLPLRDGISDLPSDTDEPDESEALKAIPPADDLSSR
jgi:hypothetical protein